MNTTNPGLNLDQGVVTGAILKAAGSGLQDECKNKYPDGIKYGEIARTSGHSLACKEVFHVTLCSGFGPDTQKVGYFLAFVYLT